MNRKHKILAVALSLLLIIIDQLTKVWIIGKIEVGKSIEIIKNFLDFTYVKNTGAAFGLFYDNATMLGIVSGVMLIVILFIVLFRSKDILLSYALMVIFAGGAGNVIDRFLRSFVVDFIDVRLAPFKNFPVFNFADCCVTIGVFFLFIYILKPQPKEEEDLVEKT